MKKLKNIKNYHLGMGFSILAIQIIFQISSSVYFFSLALILLSFYEAMVIKKLLRQKGGTEGIRKTLKQFKWFKLFAIIPILLISATLIADFKNENITELILGNPVFWINILVLGVIIMHFSLKFETQKIEKEIMSN